MKNNKSLLLVLGLLGFASGLPLALSKGTLQAWLSQSAVDLKTIGFFSLVGLPYTLKFFWAPLLDRFRLPWLGRRRGWMFVMQCAVAGCLIWMGFVNPSQEPSLLAFAAFCLSAASATHDIVFDAYRSDVLPPEQRGAGVARSVLGYRVALLISGALALILSDYIGWQYAYWSMALLMGIGLITTWLAPEPASAEKPIGSIKEAFVAPVENFIQTHPRFFAVVFFVILYKLGDAIAGALTTAFLIRQLHFSGTELGLVTKVMGFTGTIVGALWGATLLEKIGLWRGLFWFGVLQALTNLGFWLLTLAPKNIWSMASVVFVENLAGGMGTTAFVALLIGLCHKRYSATQYALLSALAALASNLVGPFCGQWVERYGWSSFFWMSFLAAIPGLLVLLYLRRYKALFEHDLPSRQELEADV